MFLIAIIIMIILIAIEAILKPRIDITSEQEVLLWYNGKTKREYNFLFRIF